MGLLLELVVAYGFIMIFKQKERRGLTRLFFTSHISESNHSPKQDDSFQPIR